MKFAETNTLEKEEKGLHFVLSNSCYAKLACCNCGSSGIISHKLLSPRRPEHPCPHPPPNAHTHWLGRGRRPARTQRVIISPIYNSEAGVKVRQAQRLRCSGLGELHRTPTSPAEETRFCAVTGSA